MVAKLFLSDCWGIVGVCLCFGDCEGVLGGC